MEYFGAQTIDRSLKAAMLTVLAAGTAALWYVLDHMLAPKLSPNEPPLVPHSIPFVGHILGLLRHGIAYYEITSAKCKLPIYTLDMLNGKVYVVASPELVSAVYRNSKALAFNPFIAQLGKRITGHDEATGEVVQHNLNGEGGSGYVIEVHDGIVAALAPGQHLEAMTETMLRETSTYLDELENGDDEIGLFAWTRRTVTLCSTRAIYGPENPFTINPDLQQEFWNFDHSLDLLMTNVAPSILAPKAYHARQNLGSFFQRYFENYIPGQTQSSAMILARYTANSQHGITSVNQGRLEVGTLLGILVNTIPAIFYMIIHIYSDPALLRDIRAELESTSVTHSPEDKTRKLKVLTMRENCPLLHSTFQELLRIHALGASARFIREDVTLNNQYLLKKNMVVQMPMAVLHADTASWGPDARAFQPRRFLKSAKPNQIAYRPFGGGSSLCPGRHFVTLETLALTARMVLRFDVAPVVGTWQIPDQRQESLATNVFPPKNDVRVRVGRRRGFEGVEWGFCMS